MTELQKVILNSLVEVLMNEFLQIIMKMEIYQAKRDLIIEHEIEQSLNTTKTEEYNQNEL